MREAVKILTRLSKQFGEKCYVTHKRFTKRGFTIHHLWYLTNGDVEHGNYPSTPKGRDKYYTDLEPLVGKRLTVAEKREFIEKLETARKEINDLIDEQITHPTRFILVTNGVHTRLDHYKRGLTRLRRENQYRLIIAMLITRKRNGK